jgi:hypothetical protein
MLAAETYLAAVNLIFFTGVLLALEELSAVGLLLSAGGGPVGTDEPVRPRPDCARAFPQTSAASNRLKTQCFSTTKLGWRAECMAPPAFFAEIKGRDSVAEFYDLKNDQKRIRNR